MNKLLIFLHAAVTLSACTNIKSVTGDYSVVENNVANIKLTLNSDHSFVEYVHAAGCEPTWYFGFYTQAGRRIILNQVSGDLSYLDKSDTIVYHNNAASKQRNIVILYNEKMPYEKAEVYANGTLYLGKVDKNGNLKIPDNVSLDSLRIESNIDKPRYFVLKKQDFNQLFLVIYDYTFENCSNITFIKNRDLAITSTGLLFYPNWERKEIPNKVYLKKIDK